jgi:hypothetical protein
MLENRKAGRTCSARQSGCQALNENPYSVIPGTVTGSSSAGSFFEPECLNFYAKKVPVAKGERGQIQRKPFDRDGETGDKKK